MNKKYVVRNMTRKELDIAVGWAAQEGWNPGLYDADCFWVIDPNGFFVGVLGDEPISCISAVAYDDTFAFLGFYITKPEYRDKGYGIQVWNAAIDYLKIQNIGLDGVVEQQENYKKSGFKLAYSNKRFEIKSKKTNTQKGLVKLGKVPLEIIEKYDSYMFPVARGEFLKCWIRQPESSSFGVVEGDQLMGYGIIRKCRSGYKIGPLFADNKEIANKLFLELNNSVEQGETIYLDVPEVNRSGMELVKDYGMNEVFGTARMYTKNEPKIDLNKIFGVTTFEVG